jgi:hypothetical protein
MANANTSTTISDNGDYSLRIEISPTVSPTNGYALKITSRWKSSAHPDEDQVQFLTCLEADALLALAQSIQKTVGMSRPTVIQA